jgi:peptidoglycan/LPS O-acetylase OafA/YrhL
MLDHGRPAANPAIPKRYGDWLGGKLPWRKLSLCYVLFLAHMLPNADVRPKLSYRRDIDGLRAIAVLLVVLFHIRTRVIGGYIGVDVFFVISGYLISSTILSEMAVGKFSIVNFYERRIRRIFPALLIMMLVTTALAYHYLAPMEMESYAKSLLAALFSVSNIFFSHQAGYFDGASGLQPLLHTWSLAVEEQFYIFFPIMLIVVRKWAPNRLKTAIWTITGVTFLMACIWVRRDPIFTFFFAPLRAWELLIGTIVSQRDTRLES